jgi:hypothetical protein
MYTRSQYGLGDALVDCLSSAITQVEGSNPNFAANNNPGNLIYVGPNQNGQTGVTPGAGGFAKFTSPASGYAAMQWQIQNYIGRGFTPTQFFNTWAPGGTSNAAGGVQTQVATNSYVSTVSGSCGLDPNTPLNQIQASYTGPGSVDTTGGDSSAASDSSSSTFDLSSILPGFDYSSSYSVGPVVLSGSDLLTLGIIAASALVISAIL